MMKQQAHVQKKSQLQLVKLMHITIMKQHTKILQMEQ